jgi:hypothetical protein
MYALQESEIRVVGVVPGNDSTETLIHHLLGLLRDALFSRLRQKHLLVDYRCFIFAHVVIYENGVISLRSE